MTISSVRRMSRSALLPKLVLFAALFVWPALYKNDFLVTTLMMAGVYAIMSIGTNLINGQTGQGSMGHAVFAGIGAYTTGLLTVNLNWPPLLALIAGVVAAAVIAYIVGRPVLKLKLWFLSMATLGLVFIFNVLVLNLRGVTGGPTGIAGIPQFGIGGLVFDTYLKSYYLIWAVVLVVLFFTLAVTRSRSGRALRAISVNETAASTLGVDVASWKLRAFVFGSALAAAAGGFFVFFLGSAAPNDFSFNLVILVLLMVMLGGQGSLTGAVVGALVVTYAQYSFSSFGQYSSGLFGFLLIVVLLFLPGGLAGGISLLGSDRRKRIRVALLKILAPNRADTVPTRAADKGVEPVAGALAAADPSGLVRGGGLPGADAQKTVGFALLETAPDGKPSTDATIKVPAGELSKSVASATNSGPIFGGRSNSGSQLGPVIKLTDVTVEFGGLQAVSHLNLEMMPGAISAIIGPNGAGKTTLFNVLSGLQKPTAGQVWYEGKDITKMRPDRIARLGMARTFQNLRIFGNMSVLDNVMTGRHMHETSHFATAGVRWPSQRREEKESRKAAMRMLEFVGLGDRATDQAGSLPYGEQRLVEIARALATEPTLLLLDEPAAGMNEGERQLLVEKIREISKAGIKVVLVEHNMGLVMSISDQVAVLDHGALVCDGDPESVQCNPQVIEAYLGTGRAEEPEVEAATATQVVAGEVLDAKDDSETLLKVKSLSTYYGSIGAIRGIDLEVKKGEVLAVLGANGAGKTTLMRTISGILRPRHGEVVFEGRDITRLSAPEIVELGVCQVPEGRHIFPTLSVYDNLVLGAGRLHRKGSEFTDALESVYQLFPRLQERRKQLAGSLSGGEQQMLAIGRGLMSHPRVLMLDEPSMGLAPVVNAAIFESLQLLNDRGLTLLMVEQNAEAALLIADRAAVMVHGEIGLTGLASDLRRDPRVRALYLGGEVD